ncbi:aldehyde dehydrogenase family 3 member B1 isoform X2 [Acipenser ruthenus]|uniref:aldehyde dehydrogenase family 3 member B1 isoform X2 n=1 Tax=Acipenser ruthenus TaxID=7906 RepID=UPI002741AA1F|nr:aldehyde dehydrogenase family 3 member B1 isoform X2 [Acipenser ruthenus]
MSDYGAIVQKLRDSFGTRKTRPAEFRISQLNSIVKLLRENEGPIVEALERDLRKPKFETMISEISMAINEANYAINHLASWMKPEHVEKSLVMKFDECFIRKEPLGVVLIIGAWNYPVQLVLVPLIGAIAAGNCAVVKPSELSDSTSSLLTELLPKYLDQSCFSVVCGGAKETTELLEQRFDHIFYTGGVSVARSVMRAASCHLTPVTLELGGKSPALVEGSCDITATARRLVWARFFNAGQSCVAPDYVLCSPETRRLLLPALRDCITQLYGTEPRESRDFGRIINQRHFERIRDLLSNSQGRVEIGGETEEGESPHGVGGCERVGPCDAGGDLRTGPPHPHCGEPGGSHQLHQLQRETTGTVSVHWRQQGGYQGDGMYQQRGVLLQ